MKILSVIKQQDTNDKDYISRNLSLHKTKLEFINSIKSNLETQNIEFYKEIGLILKHIGFQKPLVSREGDVNCRMDAVIIDPDNSIPIEIKSPGESREINIKSIRQACENKVIIMSRKFYRSDYYTTSLAIAFEYPPERSDVYELIDDIKQAYDFNIGIIDINDLLSLVWDINNHSHLNYNYFNTFCGKFEYEKAIAR